MKRLFFTADDYGLSPGVDDAILELAGQGRLSGTSCMTVFPEWEHSASRLAAYSGKMEIGLHLTLTDQPALVRGTSLAPQGKLPGLKSLLAAMAARRIAQADFAAELDAQEARFTAAFGRMPDFFDGHQHVHFLPAVRKWFAARSGRSPWLRGPAKQPALPAMTAKAAAVRTLAAGFSSAMSAAGYGFRGPLDGFYDWKNPETFPGALEAFIRRTPDGAVIMVHPGHPDAVLESRDEFVAARAHEFENLASPGFAALLEQNNAALARRQ